VLFCCVLQLVNEFRQMAEDAWKQVHRLLIVNDEWKLERDVDDICVHSQYSTRLGKILKLEVSQCFRNCFIVHMSGCCCQRAERVVSLQELVVMVTRCIKVRSGETEYMELVDVRNGIHLTTYLS